MGHEWVKHSRKRTTSKRYIWKCAQCNTRVEAFGMPNPDIKTFIWTGYLIAGIHMERPYAQVDCETNMVWQVSRM